ncbi:DinB family protein [Segeticoccus rhizosphaerae]|uniref:DinB family protein n=1 Tax=Segeticoccus rhizosphaerae TaxID=1104777 RepID=UPI00192E6421|nr:DinB family protein [Ornithinicoccus soli]
MTDNDETMTLLHYLDAQRDSVVAILDGLDDNQLNTPAVASGWTPLGLVAHLCGAEHLWLHHVLAGSAGNLPPWPLDGPYSPFTVRAQTADVVDFYRKQAAISDQNVVVADLAAPPRVAPPPELAEYAPDGRSVVVHMIEETARHAGHLDIVRELIDGRTGLGPR